PLRAPTAQPDRQAHSQPAARPSGPAGGRARDRAADPPGLRGRDSRRGRGRRPGSAALADRPPALTATIPAAIERALALVDPAQRPGDPAAVTRTGYLDLIGDAEGPTATGAAQRLMLSAAVPAIYERWWR